MLKSIHSSPNKCWKRKWKEWLIMSFESSESNVHRVFQLTSTRPSFSCSIIFTYLSKCRLVARDPTKPIAPMFRRGTIFDGENGGEVAFIIFCNSKFFTDPKFLSQTLWVILIFAFWAIFYSITPQTWNPFRDRTLIQRHWWGQDSRTHQLHNERHVLKSLQVAPVQLKRQVGIFVVGVMGCGSGTLLGSGSGTLGPEESEPERFCQKTVNACEIFPTRCLGDSLKAVDGKEGLPCQSRTSNNIHVPHILSQH